MTNAAIAIDGLQALEIALNFPAEIAFDDDLLRADRLDDVVELFRRQAFRAGVRIHVGLFEHFLREARADAVDVRQGRFDAFVAGNFNTEKAGHESCLVGS